LEHLDAYLFLYAFNLNCQLAFVICKIINFLAFQALQVCQWLSIGVLMLEKLSAEFLVIFCLMKSLGAYKELMF
jgi:hypothetical protein